MGDTVVLASSASRGGDNSPTSRAPERPCFYLSMYPEITMRGERIPVVLRLMVKERERDGRKESPKSSGGGWLI